MHLTTKERTFFLKPILLFGWRPCDFFVPASYRVVWGYNVGGGGGVEGGGLDKVRITLTPSPHGAVWPPRRDGLSSQRTGLHIALDVCFSTEISKGQNNSLPKEPNCHFFRGEGAYYVWGAGLVCREIQKFSTGKCCPTSPFICTDHSCPSHPLRSFPSIHHNVSSPPLPPEAPATGRLEAARGRLCPKQGPSGSRDVGLKNVGG